VKTRYRILKNHKTNSFHIQWKAWYWPFWTYVRTGFDNHKIWFNDIDTAKETINYWNTPDKYEVVL